MRAEIERSAHALGFSACGVTSAAPGPERQSLKQYLARGLHGDMAWMAANAARRGDPSQLWPEARSIIMLGADYSPAKPPTEILAAPTLGAISIYAQGPDYHRVLKKKLKRLATEISRGYGGEVKIFTDT
ncbi:MAG: DUF1730 domain-containing protein, partial [Alphaproteobacteria bacterium]|nr:DUF1730 domain-containing protein [Alphaproteobacteria bacterium]